MIEHFEVDRFMKWMFFAAPVILAGFALLGVALVVLPGDGQPRNVAFDRGLGTVLALMFGSAAWFSWRLVPHVKAAPVSLDGEGIWQRAKPRDSGMVPWKSITGVRERPLLQRLELLDQSGALLLRLEYQLSDFERLRAIVLSRAALAQPRGSPATTFAKGISYHIFNVSAILGFSALGIYTLTVQVLIGIAFILFVVGVGGWEYLSSVYKLQLGASDLVLHRPGRTALLRREEIQSIEVGDLLVNYVRHPQVIVRTLGEPGVVKLQNLGVQAIELQQALLRWKSGAA